MEEIQSLYDNNNYPARAKLIKLLKEAKISYSKELLDKLYSEHTVAQVFKKTKKKSVNLRYITALRQWENLQVDIIVYEKFKTTNRNFEYILIAVDVFSRYMMCQPLKSKTAEETVNAFKVMVSDIKDDILLVTTDSGNEYKGVFETYLNEEEIIHFTTSVGNHATLGIVDRACRSLRSEIEKHFVGKDTTNWVDSLQRIVTGYNNNDNRGIMNLKPKNIENNPENTETLLEMNEEKNEINKNIQKTIVKPEFKAGDYVRKKLAKSVLSKGFSQQYGSKVYKIASVENEFVVELTTGEIYEQSKLLLVPNYTEEQFNNQKETKLDKHTKQSKVRRALHSLS